MSFRSFRSSRPDQESVPRPNNDASLRMRKNGRLLPVQDETGLLCRLLGR